MQKILIVGEKRTAMFEMIAIAKGLDDKDLLSKSKAKIETEMKKGYIEGEKYIITWAAGHMFMIELPERVDKTYKRFIPFKSDKEYEMRKLKDAPFVSDNDPSRYDTKWQKTNHDFCIYKSKQYDIMTKQIQRKDLKEIILFADADAEGERISREPVMEQFKKYPHLKKIKITRAWNSGSFKANASIVKSLKNRKSYLDKKYDNLFWSARARAKNDYIIGMKISKVLTEKYYKSLSTGRVQAPILATLYKRENDIKNFKPQPFWKLKGNLKDLEFNHFYYSEDISDDGKPIKTKESNYWIKDDIDEVIKQCKDKDLIGKVISFKKTKRVSNRPTLYSTNTFQDHFIGKYRVTLEQATYAIEYLREEGFTTYPRTNGHFFSNDDIDEVKEGVNTGLKLFKNIKIIKDNLSSIKVDIKNNIFNNSKASKQNHTPLNITNKIPTEKDFERWDKVFYKKKKLVKVKEAYMLIAKRLMIQFLPDDLIEKQNIIIDINNNLFEANGEKALIQGWRELSGDLKKDTSFKTTLKNGDNIQLDNINLIEGLTKKPSIYTVKSLQQFMVNVNRTLDEEINSITNKKERIKKKEEYKELKKIFREIEGIGTDATRKDIILLLQKKKYIEIKGKKEEIHLLPAGIFLIERLPNYIKNIQTTALWEIELEKIRLGEIKYTDFINKVDDFYINKILPEILKKFEAEKSSVLLPSEKQINFAKSIAKSMGVELPKSCLTDKKDIQDWITKNKKNYEPSYNFSEKQKAIFIKNAPKTILTLINKEKLTMTEFKKCKTWLDNYFKKGSKGKEVTYTKISDKQKNLILKQGDKKIIDIVNKKTLNESDFKACKEWLDNYFKKGSKGKAVTYTKISDKQKNLILKQGDKKIIDIVNKKTLNESDFKACKAWLDNYFKSFKK